MESYWAPALTGPSPRYAKLEGPLEVDVAIVGAGIVGLTAAQLLSRSGKRVAVLEARQVGRQATGKSTAKITSQHGQIYRKLVDRFGDEGARTYAQANEAAIKRIADFVRELAIDCSFEEQPAYVYSRSDSEVAALRAEAEAAANLGLPATFVQDLDLPFPVAGALRFDGQAQFNPLRYLLGLAAGLADSGQVFEETRVTSVENGEPCMLETDSGARIEAREVILATQLPTIPEGKFFARAYPFAHPMIAARIDPARAPAGMFISAGQPSHSFRTDRSDGATYLVAAGGTYKPGDTEAGMAMTRELEDFVGRTFGIDSVEYRWTSEDFASMDGVPFIGRASESATHLYVATGFNAWGITNGTAAGMLLFDLLLGRENPWSELFDAQRFRAGSGGPTFLKENVAVAKEFAKGHLFESRPHDLELAPGQGAVVKHEGKQLAVSKEMDGTIRKLSAICTHLGCVVGWNAVDRTWDCPCHGSRFLADGSVLSGPATKALKRES